MKPPEPAEDKSRPALPVEVELYINPDGSVTFADLEAGTVFIARHLNPDQALACDAADPEPRQERDSSEGDGSDV